MEKAQMITKMQKLLLKGIVNGIDYEEYNPSTDVIYIEIIVNDLENKKIENKLILQQELGLPQRADVPMIGLVSRLTHQKGCDLIINIIEELLQKDIQFVVLGTGDYLYEESFKSFQGRYPNKVSAI